MHLNINGLIQLFKNVLIVTGIHERITYAQLMEAENLILKELTYNTDVFIKKEE